MRDMNSTETLPDAWFPKTGGGEISTLANPFKKSCP